MRWSTRKTTEEIEAASWKNANFFNSFVFISSRGSFFLSFLAPAILCCMQGELVQVHAESRFSSISEVKERNGQGKKEY
jgi:hypothetical protein